MFKNNVAFRCYGGATIRVGFYLGKAAQSVENASVWIADLVGRVPLAGSLPNEIPSDPRKEPYTLEAVRKDARGDALRLPGGANPFPGGSHTR